MSSDNIAYYRWRAQVERDQARASKNANVAEIHEELARSYTALVEHKPLRPKLSIIVHLRQST